jgi:nucleoside-triphosphatase THEP1
MKPQMPSNILAVVYSDGLAADKFIAGWGYALRSAGLTVAGLVQHNSFVRNPAKCDMEVEELYSGTVLQLSEDRGPEAQGCRLDRAILAEAAALLDKALDDKPDVMVLNKFGKTEAEGAGLRDVLAKAVDCDVPIVVGVPFRNIDQWRIFAGDMAEECQVDPSCVRRWLEARDLLPEQQWSPGVAVGTGRSAN